MMPVTQGLLFANIAVFLLEAGGMMRLDAFALWPPGGFESNFQPWQLVTYAFLHGGLAHLFFNMLGLYMFGSEIERLFGSRFYAAYYLGCVVSAALSHLAVNAFMGAPGVPMVGASGGVYGLLLAFGVYFPHRRVLLLFPPVPLPARVFVAGFAVLALFFGVTGTAAGVAHLAHLGGMLGGWLMILYRRHVQEAGDMESARHEKCMKRSERSRSMPARLLLAAALATACHAALAQDSAVPPAVGVQRLAPQLVSFAGSEANFQSLVNGLANGTQVQLFTLLPNGFVQNVSFTPRAALTPTQVAQILETARQQLIGLGIGAPTAEQLGFALMGGVVPTALGGAQVPGALNSQTPQTLPSPAAQIQGQASAGATAPTTTGTGTSTTPGVINSVNVQTTPGTAGATTIGATGTLPRANTSDSAIPAGATSRSVAPFTSASPIAATPVQAPRAIERVPAGTRPARN